MSALHTNQTRNRRLSLSESKEIAARAASGESVTELAAAFGVSRPTIYRAIEKNGAKVGASAADPRVSIRLTRQEVSALDALAGRLGLSRSALGRAVLRLAADFIEPDDETLSAIRDLSRQIKTVGGNLNQIAAHLNREARMQGKASVSARQWQEVEAAQKDLRRFAGQIDDLFIYAAKRRRTRNADILRRAAK